MLTSSHVKVIVGQTKLYSFLGKEKIRWILELFILHNFRRLITSKFDKLKQSPFSALNHLCLLALVLVVT